MTEGQRKALIKKHIKGARKFFLVPKHVRINLYFDDTPEGAGGSACAFCEPRYDFANLHFDLSQITTERECAEMAAHETAHVAQMYADELIEDALIAVKGKRTKTLHEVLLHAIELRTTLLTRMYIGSL